MSLLPGSHLGPYNDTQGKARLYAAPIVGRQAKGLRMAITF
jgi:hypothetical protein